VRRGGPPSVAARRAARSNRAARLPLQPLRDVVHEPVGRYAHLLQRIPVPYRDGTVLRRLPVDRDAEWRSGLVLAAVAAPDRATVVVEGVAVVAHVVVDAAGQLGHPVLVHEWKYRRLERGDGGTEAEHDALLPRHVLLVVGVAQHHERGAVRAGGRLDYVGDEPLIRRG